MSDILERICQDKRAHVAACRANRSLESLTAAAKDTSPPRGFAARLSAAVEGGRYGLICEIKKASPSKGLICEDFAPASLASGYEAGGAACLSVLTDVPYFQGSDSDLTDARGAVTLPVLRKDFMVDPYQIVESRALGADCVLLILAALGDAQAKELEDAALGSGLDVLVEVHNATELDRALQLQTQLIGINNRDLKTFDTTLETTFALRPSIPAGVTVVSESGIDNRDDVERLAAAAIDAILVGEALMREPDPGAKLRDLLGT